MLELEVKLFRLKNRGEERWKIKKSCVKDLSDKLLKIRRRGDSEIKWVFYMMLFEKIIEIIMILIYKFKKFYEI